jgi:hypothetical protein
MKEVFDILASHPITSILLGLLILAIISELRG